MFLKNLQGWGRHHLAGRSSTELTLARLLGKKPITFRTGAMLLYALR